MKFKHEKDIERVLYLHPVALIVLFDVKVWCLTRELPLVITSTVSTKKEDEALRRKSATHREGRAFDISIEGWNKQDIKDFIWHFSKKYDEFAAKKLDGEKVLIPPVDHGSAPHIHVQLSRVLSSEDINLNNKVDFLIKEAFYLMVGE